MDRSEWVRVPMYPPQMALDYLKVPEVGNWHGMLSLMPVPPKEAPPPPAEQASGDDAPVAATLADAAADPALTMEAARELLADTAKAITAGAYAALSQRPVVDEAMVARAVNAWCDVADMDEWRVWNTSEALRAALTAALAPQQPEKGEG